jgi:cyclophilin family peptidyl-prolyl cis-trans isomerase
MQRGDVGWAGGGAGPDFFIYLGQRPADWLKRDHTVWAEVTDAESLAVADRIVQLPSHTPGGPNTMRFLKNRLEINVVPAAGGGDEGRGAARSISTVE